MGTKQGASVAISKARRLVGQRAARELVPATPGASARWHVHDYPGVYCRWNYHPEYEVHLIQHGTGRSIVGDHIGRFRPGHLVLVGSNLPHHWISDLDPGEHITDRDVVFQFHPQWFHDCQELMPELAAAKSLLNRAARGIEFTGTSAATAADELIAIGHTERAYGLQHILPCSSSSMKRPAMRRSAGQPLDPAAPRGRRRPGRRHPRLHLHQHRRRNPDGRRGHPSRHVRISLLPLLPTRQRSELHRHRTQAAAGPRLSTPQAHRRHRRRNLPPGRLPKPVQLQPAVPTRTTASPHEKSDGTANTDTTTPRPAPEGRPVMRDIAVLGCPGCVSGWGSDRRQSSADTVLDPSDALPSPTGPASPFSRREKSVRAGGIRGGTGKSLGRSLAAMSPFPLVRRGFGWWSCGDSNPGPSHCERDALPTAPQPQVRTTR